jgi:hypothetical protein
VARTAASSLTPAALAILLACGDASGPRATARIDYVDGAIEPILVRGQRFVVEGFGFGAAGDDGAVRFAKQAGGETAAPVTEWSERLITATVPDSAGSGPLVVVTARGSRLTAPVHVLPAVPFDPSSLAWRQRTEFPGSPVGVALAAAEFPAGATLRTAIYAAGGGEPIGGDSVIVPDSGVYLARAGPDGVIGPWARQRDHSDPLRHRALPVRRAFAVAAFATRYNSRFPGAVLYVLGGVDSAGRAHASVFAADVSADSVVGRFLALEPLPAPVWGAIAVVRRGRIYVIGGADSLGRPQARVFVGRVGVDGHIDGWYQQPSLPGPRALGGGVVLDQGIAVFGGVAEAVPPGGGLDAMPTRLVTSDTAPLSLASGFFRGPWAGGPAPLPEGRSQFTTLVVGDRILAVGGMYGGAATNAAETVAAVLGAQSLGPFTGPVGTASIFGQGGGTLVGAAGVTWREPDGRHRALLVGGMDLQTRLRTARCWGF